jgi:hypothetical protein
MGWFWIIIVIMVIVILGNCPNFFFYPLYAIFAIVALLVSIFFVVIIVGFIILMVKGVIDLIKNGISRSCSGYSSGGNPCDPYPHDNAQSPMTDADYAEAQEQGSWHD